MKPTAPYRVIDLLNKLSDDGTLQQLMDAGLMPPKVIGYREMYLKYDINRRVEGMKSDQAKYAVCVLFRNCDKRTIERAIKAMTKPCRNNGCE